MCVSVCVHACIIALFQKRLYDTFLSIGDNCAQWPGLLGRGYLVTDTTIYLFNTEEEGYLCKLVKAVTLS